MLGDAADAFGCIAGKVANFKEPYLRNQVTARHRPEAMRQNTDLHQAEEVARITRLRQMGAKIQTCARWPGGQRQCNTPAPGG